MLGVLIAVNAGFALALGGGKVLIAVPLALLPVLLLAVGWLLAGHRVVLACAALALGFPVFGKLDRPLPFSGGIAIYVTDIILLLAVGAWVAERLTKRERDTERYPIPLAITWPLLPFAAFVCLAIVRGNEQYGTGLFGQPVRLLLYALIGVAIVGTDARTVWRGITAVFYAGAIVEALLAAYYLAAGGSQTDSLSLSTGGTRILALGTGTYLIGSLVCALLNIERNEGRFGRQLMHTAVGGLALFGIVLCFGRTIYVAVAVIVLVLVLSRKVLRRSLLWILPLLLPAMIAIALVIPLAAPTVVPTLSARLGASPSTDINVEWRTRALDSALDGLSQHPLTGFGFGHPVRFTFLGQLVDLTGDPHNSYVYILAGGGFLALGSLLAIMLAYLVDVARRMRGAAGYEQTVLIWSLATWFGFMVQAFEEPVLTNATMMMTIWILMLLPWCAQVHRRPSEQPEPSPAAVTALGRSPAQLYQA